MDRDASANTAAAYITAITDDCKEAAARRCRAAARATISKAFRASGSADVADSLAAIKKLVFETKR